MRFVSHFASSSFLSSLFIVLSVVTSLLIPSFAFLHTVNKTTQSKIEPAILHHDYHRTHKKSPRVVALNLGSFFNFDKDEGETETKKDDSSSISSDDDEIEPAEKIFNFFFGAKEERPGGNARFGPDRFPEQYPATKTEWADPVESDTKEMSVIRPFLKNTNLERRGLKLTYDANQNGWDPISFHNAVDKKGGAVVICTSQDGSIFGGYNPKGWVGYGEARGSIAAFLFVVGGPYAKDDAPGYKLIKVGGPGLAQMDMPEKGPSFGADSLVINLSAENPKGARSKLGSYYERFPDDVNSLFVDNSSTQLKDLKVYHGVYADGEYIPFTDAEPFALY